MFSRLWFVVRGLLFRVRDSRLVANCFAGFIHSSFDAVFSALQSRIDQYPSNSHHRTPNHEQRTTNNKQQTTRILLLLCLVLTSCNPFAPALEEGDPFATLLGDPTTIDGFFTNFQTAYELRDMSLYEPLIDSAFTFTYYDFDVQVEKQWNFSQEIESTRRLFQNTSFAQLQWNQIISQNIFADSLQARVVRSFNLTINLESGDVFRGDGNVNFVIARDAAGQPWQLLRWRDESEF